MQPSLSKSPPSTSKPPSAYVAHFRVIAGGGVGHRRKPVCRRNAKQSGASLLMRVSPSSAASATSPMLSAHRFASSFDFHVAPHFLSRIELRRIARQPLYP